MQLAALVARAEPGDVGEILNLQKLAFVVEAELYSDYAIDPLVETEEQVREAISRGTVLKALASGTIVGSVRASAADGRCHIARLAVHPAYQRQGVAVQLMRAVETQVMASEYRLHTGHKSVGNLRLYALLGYAEVRREVVSEDLSFVHMVKFSG